MKRDHHFRPVVAELLEPRVLPSHGARIQPATVSPVNASARAVPVGGLAHAVVDQVNQEFDSFTNDYLQAQGAYFATDSSNATNAANAERFFRSYIEQRLNLLAQQLIRTFTQLPGSLNRLPGAPPGGSYVLQVFLRDKINGTTAGSLRTALAGNKVIPAPGTVTGGAATLYTEQALGAIETARAATLNASTFLLRHTFQNGRPAAH
jgi:hypothetical protein